MKRLIVAIVMLLSIVCLMGAYAPEGNNFKIINGVLEQKTDNGIIVRCIKIKYDPPRKNPSTDDSRKGETKDKHKKTDKHDKDKDKGKDKHKDKDNDNQEALIAAIEAYKKQYEEQVKSLAQGLIMLKDYPNVNNLAIGDVVKIGAFEIGTIDQYSIDGKVVHKSLKLYSISPEK